jgi:hypothetical protein
MKLWKADSTALDRRSAPPVLGSPGLAAGLGLVLAMAGLVGVIAAAGSGRPQPVSPPPDSPPPVSSPPTALTPADGPAGCPTSGPASGPGLLPPEAEAEKAVVGDFDGDRRADRFLLYDPSPDPGTVAFPSDGPPPRMRVELAAGAIVDVPAETLWRGAMAVGVADVNHDGVDEVVVDPRRGATGFTVDLVTFVGCRPVPVTEPDGSPPVLYYYQNSSCCVGEIVGVECADVDGDSRTELVTIDEKPSGEWSYQAYRLEGDHAVPARSGHGTGRAGRPGTLRFSGGFDCGGFQY